MIQHGDRNEVVKVRNENLIFEPKFWIHDRCQVKHPPVKFNANSLPKIAEQPPQPFKCTLVSIRVAVVILTTEVEIKSFSLKE